MDYFELFVHKEDSFTYLCKDIHDLFFTVHVVFELFIFGLYKFLLFPSLLNLMCQSSTFIKVHYKTRLPIFWDFYLSHMANPIYRIRLKSSFDNLVSYLQLIDKSVVFVLFSLHHFDCWNYIPVIIIFPKDSTLCSIFKKFISVFILGVDSWISR